MIQNRKTATKLLLVQWSRFQNVCMKLEGSTLFTGVNGSGKSTILDAMTYVLTGNTQFNKAAKDRDRTVKAYVRGDTKSNGPMRYLRSGQVISYIAMEFYSPIEEENMVIGVCIESPDEASSPTSHWFVCKNTSMEDINFASVQEKKLYVTPKSMLTVKGERLKAAEFMGRDRGTEQVLRALGLRCEAAKYRSKLLKMMAFNPENNIDQFISECVLEPGTVNSLKELREQREQFEHLKGVYEGLRDGKKKLEEVEMRILDYEEKKRVLHIREMMFSYQEFLAKEKEKEELKISLAALEQQKNGLEQQKETVEILFEEARKRLQAAESNDTFCGMQNSISILKNEIAELARNIQKQQEETAKLLRLQQAFFGELSWMLEEYQGNREILEHLAETEYSVEKKREQFVFFLHNAEKQKAALETDRVHEEDRLKELKTEISALEEKLKLLESNQLILPQEVEKAKQILKTEFERRKIHTEVRVFAELVQEVKDADWRMAIETFLGKKRFYIIVDGDYCHAAMEILQEKKLYAANVVITDKLPETNVTKGSAAEQLVIPNLFARRYANYLLNGIHLCDSLKELHEYPKGGLMKNGMLAKSYAVSLMDMRKTEICLGQDAIELQKQSTAEQQKLKKEDYSQSEQKLRQTKKKLESLKVIDWNAANYHLEAPDLLLENQKKKKMREENVEQIENNPDFMAVLKEQQDAKHAYQEVDKKRAGIERKLGSCEREYKEVKEHQGTIAAEIHVKQKAYEELRTAHLELEETMLADYEVLSKKKDTISVMTQQSVQKAKNEVDKSIQDLETAQLEYCKVSEMDLNQRGVGYIPFYRAEHRNLANVKIEEAYSRLEKQSKKLESAFMNDFVAEINEKIGAAKQEIDAINRELKQIPFGQDTYKFRMDEKPDRSIFFRICKNLQNYMGSPEVYMNSARDDEEMERDIQEFMNLILLEEDESEYTDYRRYFTYDMEISSHQGDKEITADLSKKQGSASNGEKQTPYFIILAASLLQCYPAKNCCARLAFIDEAFSALSRERIEQMVKYLEENHFQVIYAAPPEKIGSIGQFIHSTVSLVVTGRYTNAVEGLVTVDEIYG